MTAHRAGLALALLLALAVAFAQEGLQLTVQGVRVPGATTELVPGSTYAPAPELAAAMGAVFASDRNTGVATFVLGGHTLALDVSDDATAPEADGAARLDGRPIGTALAIRVNVEVFVPVAEVLRAFGGSVHYLGPEDGVVGVLPRATVVAMRLERTTPEALRIDLDAGVPVSVYRDEALGTLQIRVERASVAQARSFEGAGILRADVFGRDGGVDVRVQLDRGAVADVLQLPSGGGFQLAIVVREATATSETPASGAEGPHVVLDPWRPLGTLDANATRDAERTLSFAARLAEALRARGLRVDLTRADGAAPSPARRAALAADADLFLALSVGASATGEYGLYYLGDADTLATLQTALRRNAAAALAGTSDATDDATDALRREILLGVLPDLEAGRRFAEGLRRELLLVGGYATPGIVAAPLLPIADAAGRGLLLEFAASDLSGDLLSDALADAVATIVGGSGP